MNSRLIIDCMKASISKLFILFSISLALMVVFVLASESIDEDVPLQTEKSIGLVDPGDMTRYDFEPENAEAVFSCADQSSVTGDDFRRLRDKIDHCNQQLDALTDTHNKCLQDLDSMLDLKKYLHIVLMKVSSLGTSKIQVQFTEDHILILKDYLFHNKGNVQEVNDLFDELLNEAKGVHSVMGSVSLFVKHEFAFVAVIFIVLMTSIAIEKLIKISWRRQMLWIVIWGFFLSILWEWICLYRREFAQKQSQVITQAPQHCSPGITTAYDSFNIWIKRMFTFSDDPCSKYQKELLVDPLWEITPVQAVSATLTKLFATPLEHIAHATDKGFKAYSKEFPTQEQLKQLEGKTNELLKLIKEQRKENQQLLAALKTKGKIKK